MHKKRPSKKKLVKSIHGGLDNELAVKTPSKKIKRVGQTWNELVDKTPFDRSNIEATPVDRSTVYVNLEDRNYDAPNLVPPSNSSIGFQESAEISAIGKLLRHSI